MCFFFNDTATTEIYTLSLHDALPIFLADGQVGPGIAGERVARGLRVRRAQPDGHLDLGREWHDGDHNRSEEHTSELQSRQYLVCRLLLEKKKTMICDRQKGAAQRF